MCYGKGETRNYYQRVRMKYPCRLILSVLSLISGIEVLPLSAEYITVGNLRYEILQGEENRVMVSRSEEGGAYTGDVIVPSSIVSSDNREYSVVGIADGAFRESLVSSVVFEGPVEFAGEYCFYGCPSIERIEISGGLQSIGDRAMAGCQSLTSVVLEGTYETVPDQLFHGDSSLESVKLSERFIEIGEGSFYGCSSLKSFTLPETLVLIGRSAFEGCYNLQSLEFTGIDIEIGDFAFRSCSLLKRLEGLKNVRVIGDGGFTGCSSIESLNLVEGPEEIGESCFMGCSSLKHLEFGDRLTDIPRLAFSHCDGIETIIFGNSVKSIGDMAFKSCLSLSDIEIGYGMRSIGSESFYDCPGLKAIYVDSTIPPFAPRKAFETAVYRSSSLYVPIDLKPLYSQSPGWEHFLNISETSEFLSHSLVENPTAGRHWTITDALLTVGNIGRLQICLPDGTVIFSGIVAPGRQILLPRNSCLLINGECVMIR